MDRSTGIRKYGTSELRIRSYKRFDPDLLRRYKYRLTVLDQG